MSERAYIGLGSNLDNPVMQITRAVEWIREFEAVDVQAVSSLYRTKAVTWDPLESQPDYINAVVGVDTTLEPMELLALLLALEIKQGRNRTTDQKWAPRTLDCDILLFGDRVLSTPELTIPHPHMYQRNFVLVPLHEIAPNCVGPDALEQINLQEISPCPSLTH